MDSFGVNSAMQGNSVSDFVIPPTHCCPDSLLDRSTLCKSLSPGRFGLGDKSTSPNLVESRIWRMIQEKIWEMRFIPVLFLVDVVSALLLCLVVEHL